MAPGAATGARPEDGHSNARLRAVLSLIDHLQLDGADSQSDRVVSCLLDLYGDANCAKIALGSLEGRRELASASTSTASAVRDNAHHKLSLMRPKSMLAASSASTCAAGCTLRLGRTDR